MLDLTEGKLNEDSHNVDSERNEQTYLLVGKKRARSSTKAGKMHEVEYNVENDDSRASANNDTFGSLEVKSERTQQVGRRNTKRAAKEIRLWSAVASEARHRFGNRRPARNVPCQSAVAAALCRRSPKSSALVPVAPVRRVANEVYGVGQAELALDVVAVSLDGLRAEGELLRDFLVVPAFAQQAEDLQLAVGEALDAVAITPAGLLAQSLLDLGGELLAHVALAADDDAQAA